MQKANLIGWLDQTIYLVNVLAAASAAMAVKNNCEELLPDVFLQQVSAMQGSVLDQHETASRKHERL